MSGCGCYIQGTGDVWLDDDTAIPTAEIIYCQRHAAVDKLVEALHTATKLNHMLDKPEGITLDTFHEHYSITCAVMCAALRAAGEVRDE